jgi:hypothetical protein
MTDPVKFRYQAFLSYSHRDVLQGTKLHAALENYRVPSDLVGGPGTHGPTPPRLRPIFRDRFDLEAGHSLREQVIEALKSSAALIVLCSPHSAKSSYVNEEIRLFKMQGRGDRIYAIIVDGEPGDPERECFPPNLGRVIGADGVPTGETEEPLAADVRPQGDGEELAKLKLIAGLLGVDLDDLRKREEIERRKQKRRLVMVAGFMSVLAVCAVAFGAATWVLNGQVDAANAALTNTNMQLQNALMVSEERYAQSLTTNLQLVTIAATFNSIIANQPFSVMEVNAKLANADFNRFLTGRNDDVVTMRHTESVSSSAKMHVTGTCSLAISGAVGFAGPARPPSQSEKWNSNVALADGLRSATAATCAFWTGDSRFTRKGVTSAPNEYPTISTRSVCQALA